MIPCKNLLKLYFLIKQYVVQYANSELLLKNFYTNRTHRRFHIRKKYSLRIHYKGVILIKYCLLEPSLISYHKLKDHPNLSVLAMNCLIFWCNFSNLFVIKVENGLVWLQQHCIFIKSVWMNFTNQFWTKNQIKRPPKFERL